MLFHGSFMVFLCISDILFMQPVCLFSWPFDGMHIHTHTHSELEEYTHTRTNALISRQCFIFHTHTESVCIFSTGTHILLLYMPDCFSGSWDEAAWMCVSGGKDKRMRERVKWFWQQTASPARRLTKRLFPWTHWLWPCFWIKHDASQA